MARWFRKVTANPNDIFTPLGEAIEHFHNEYEEARKELRPYKGQLITSVSSNLPGIVEYRYGQLQEIEGILRFLELQYDKTKGNVKKNFLENYQRTLSDRQADQYADIDPEVMILREFINETALVRNMFLGITKGLETLHFQLPNIVKLKIAGFEDATF